MHLSRKDPAYVGRAKEVQKAQKAIEAGKCPLDALEELKPVIDGNPAKTSRKLEKETLESEAPSLQ